MNKIHFSFFGAAQSRAIVFLLLFCLLSCQKPPLASSSAVALPSSGKALNQYTLLSDAEQAWADSLLAYGLDHEALYSLMDSLKPMSSLKMLKFSLAKDSLQQAGDEYILKNQPALDSVAYYQNILNHLHTDKLRFCLIPFKRVQDTERYLQILVVNLDAYQKVLQEKAHFFGQWGFNLHTPPEVLLTVIEFENKLDRFRAYGYLFGYPSHAVDFFVEADKEEDRTGEFVKRSFFPVSTYSAKTGYFTYALPKDFTPIDTDSLILKRAESILERYQAIRPQFKTSAGIKAHALLAWVWGED